MIDAEFKGYLTPSPNARLVVEEGTAAKLMRCEAPGESAELGPASAVVWSPNSRYLSLASEDGSSRFMAVGEDLRAIEVWSHAAANLERLGPDGTQALVTTDAGQLLLLRFEADESVQVTPIASSPTDAVWLMSDDALLLERTVADESDERELLWLPLASTVTPRVVLTYTSGALELVADDLARGQAVLGRKAEGATEALFLRFDGAGFDLHALTTAAALGRFALAPDGGGIAGVVESEDFSSAALWFAFEPSGAPAVPLELARDVKAVGFQPWF